MQVVIDIDEKTYKRIANNQYAIYDKMYNSIKDGTPLPKNHGRIVDLDTVTVEEDTDKGVLWLDAPTILEAYYRK